MFVAHRLRTIYDSDQILVLRDGHVAEVGTHSELLQRGGIYAELWHGSFSDFFFPDEGGEMYTDVSFLQRKSYRWLAMRTSNET